MKKAIGWFAKYILPYGITVVLLLWFFHQVNFRDVMDIIHRGCNFWWIGAMMLFTTLALIVRGIRWGMQLKAAGCRKLPLMVSSCAIFGAYALNLVFPRLGEAWRCLYISRTQKCSFMTVVGTDIGDRTADLICVVVTIILAIFLTPSQLREFAHHYAVGEIINDVLKSYWLWIGVGIAVGGSWALLHFGRGIRWVEKYRSMLRNIWDGFAALFHVRPAGLFLWLTLALWTCYFLQTYVCFFSFSFTKDLAVEPGTALGLLPGLLCLVFGSCSTLIPSNGGLGPWTIAVAYALELFGVAPADAAAYALIVWGMETVMLIALGIFTVFYVRRKVNMPEEEDDTPDEGKPVTMEGKVAEKVES